MTLPTVAQSTQASTSSGTGLTLTLGAGPAPGDIIVVWFNISQFGGSRDLALTSGAIVDSNGHTWTLLDSVVNVDNRLVTITRTAGGTEPASFAFNITGTAQTHSANAQVIRGSSGVAAHIAANTQTTSLVAPNTGDLPTAGFIQNDGTGNGNTVNSVATAGWATDQNNAPGFHANVVGHGPATTAGVAVAPTVTWGGTVQNPMSAIVILAAPVATFPGAPTGVAAAAGVASGTVTFTAPASDGGSAITGYTATSTPGGLTGTVAGAAAAPITVSGLTPGVAYTFTVHATNAVGNSAESAASNAVTPTAPPPATYKVYADVSGAAFGAASVWTDITDWVLTAGEDPPINITWGKADEAADPQPRTCSFRLDNSDGRFTPGRAASPYYPYIDLGLHVRVVMIDGATTYYRFDGYANDPAASWEGGGPMSIMEVTCSDIIARFDADTPLRSMLSETILLDNPDVYLPLTDAGGIASPEVVSGRVATGSPSVLSSKYGGGTATFSGGAGPAAEGTQALALAQPGGLQGSVLNVPLRLLWATSLAHPSLHLRVNWTGTATAGYLALVAANTVGNRSVILGLDGAGHLRATVAGATVTSAAAINDGKPHDLAMSIVWAASNVYNITLYIDGIASRTAPVALTSDYLLTQMQVGGQVDAGGQGNFVSGTYSHAALHVGGGVAFTPNWANHDTAGRTGFAGEATDLHVARLLSFRPNTGSALDVGRSVIGLHQIQGVTLAQALLDTAKAEGGLIFADGQGRTTFYNRARLYNPTATVTLDTNLDQVASDLVFRRDAQLIANDVTYTRAGTGSGQRLYDTTSQAKYGYRTNDDTLVVNTDQDALDAAGWTLATRKTGKNRSPQTTVDLLTEPSQLQRQAVLAASPWTALQLTNLPATTSPATTVTEFIEGGSEQIGIDVWNVSFFTAPMPPNTLRADATAGAYTKLDAGLVIAR